MRNPDGRTPIRLHLVLTPRGEGWDTLCLSTPSVAKDVATFLGGRVAEVNTTLAQLIDAGARVDYLPEVPGV